MNEIVVQIMVKLLSTLALATKELKQGRSSDSVLADVLPFTHHSAVKSVKKTLRGGGGRGGPPEAGPTHARRGSDYRISNSRGRPRSGPEYESSHGRWANTLDLYSVLG